MEKLLLVNKKDEVIGQASKEECHRGDGILHRAFSVYLFDDKGRILIQQRSKFKKLWPLYWANSCCSHPRKDEPYEKAGERRLKEELGFSVPLKMIDKFQYKARYKNIGSENEIDAVLIGEYKGEKIKPNPEEVADWKLVKIEDLIKDMRKNPNKYTPWFRIGLKRYLKIKKKKEKIKKELFSFLEKVATKVNSVSKELLESFIDKKFQEIVNYQNASGGKRLRPFLAIVSARLLGGKEKDILYPAAGLEILHNCTLIIDDIIDHSETRRSKPTLWKKFGKSIAECIVLDYLASAFEGANYSEKPTVVSKIFARTLKTIIDGEIYDILFEQWGRGDEEYVIKNRYRKISKEDYFKMVSKKTASLFQSSCEVGAILGGGKKREIELLKGYGFNLGMAFQIQDDILDIFGKEKSFGKKIGKDIEERKLGNIVIFYALQEMSLKDKNTLLGILRKDRINQKDIKKVIFLINQTKAKEKAVKLAQEFVQKAKDNLRFLPQNKWSQFLNFLADFAIKREK